MSFDLHILGIIVSVCFSRDFFSLVGFSYSGAAFADYFIGLYNHQSAVK